jgi:hypothetical protein
MEDRPTSKRGVPWGRRTEFFSQFLVFWGQQFHGNSVEIPWKFGIYLVSNPVFFPPCLAWMKKLPTWMQTETGRNHSGCGFMFLWLLRTDGTMVSRSKHLQVCLKMAVLSVLSPDVGKIL